MAKRSHKEGVTEFKRHKNDLYRTEDPRPAKILADFLGYPVIFHECCAGDGILAKNLEDSGLLVGGITDIEPLNSVYTFDLVSKKDVMRLVDCSGECFITNPPWTRQILHPMIDHLRKIAPTWLLFDSNWCNTAQSSELMQYCSDIIPVGRVKWFDGKTGMDDTSWYRFVRGKVPTTMHQMKEGRKTYRVNTGIET